jgi:hypothetical protein
MNDSKKLFLILAILSLSIVSIVFWVSLYETYHQGFKDGIAWQIEDEKFSAEVEQADQDREGKQL